MDVSWRETPSCWVDLQEPVKSIPAKRFPLASSLHPLAGHGTKPMGAHLIFGNTHPSHGSRLSVRALVPRGLWAVPRAPSGLDTTKDLEEFGS